VTRTGADSTNAEYLPAGLDLYLGYVDGNYRSFDAIRARFPGRLVVPIATQPSGNVGVVGDGPPDNGSWPEWVEWVVRRRHDGVDPTMYTDQSSWPAGVQAFNQAGVAQPHWWIAHWNDHPAIPAGAIGVQYQSVPNRYDLSAFVDYWPGVDPVPKPPAGPGTGTPAGGTGSSSHPQPPAQRVKDMLLTAVPHPGETYHDYYLLSGPLYVHVPDIPTLKALQDAGIPSAQITTAMHTAILAGIGLLEHPVGGGGGGVVASRT
jgi:hypothetical protein